MRTLLVWLFGFVTARMVGSEPEALLNQCAQRGLTLWKMERLDPVTLLVKVPAVQWRRVEALAERMGCQAEGRTAAGRALFFGALPAAVWAAGGSGAVPPPLRGGEPDDPDL